MEKEISNENNVVTKDTIQHDASKDFHIKSLITLFGTSNSGKTSTLMDLVMLLTNATVKKYINTYLVDVNTKTGLNYYNDAMFIFKYKNLNVYLSTFGDYREICERNCHFFERKKYLLKTGLIHVIDGKTIITMDKLPSKTQNKYYKKKEYQPDICISACRTDGGPVDAMMYFSDKILPQVQNEIWLRKWRDPQNYKPKPIDKMPSIINVDDDKLAKEIKQLLDRMIKGKSI